MIKMIMIKKKSKLFSKNYYYTIQSWIKSRNQENITKFGQPNMEEEEEEKTIFRASLRELKRIENID